MRSACLSQMPAQAPALAAGFGNVQRDADVLVMANDPTSTEPAA